MSPEADRPAPAQDPRHRRVRAEEVAAALALAGWVADISAGRTEAALAGGAAALRMALSEGAGFALGPDGAPRYDFAEIEGFLGWLSETGRYPEWHDQWLACIRASVATTRAGDRPADPAAPPPPTRFRVAFRRTFGLRGFAPNTPLRLLLPAPLSSPYHDDIVVDPRVAEGLVARVRLADGRIEARLAAPDAERLDLAAEFTFTARPPGLDPGAGRLEARMRDLHLRASEGLIQVTPTIADLARRLAGAAPPLEAVTAFWTYLVDGFRFRRVRYDELPPASPCDWGLTNRAYDCRLAACMLVALCRARDIPARLVSGHYLSRVTPTNHNWAEIWIDGMGWLPADPVGWERTDPRWRPGEGWWEHFIRRWDYRLVFERPPLAFLGPMSVRFPPVWQMLQTAVPGGALTTYVDVADGALIHADEIRVDWDV